MSAPLQKRLFGALAMILTLTNCSAQQVALDQTESAVFQALSKTLPTASRLDTEQTRREVGTHRAVFFELCTRRGFCREASAEPIATELTAR